MADGWLPVAAACSERVICFEHAELATYLDTGESCATFKKKVEVLQVCVNTIADNALVKSVQRSDSPNAGVD